MKQWERRGKNVMLLGISMSKVLEQRSLSSLMAFILKGIHSLFVLPVRDYAPGQGGSCNIKHILLFSVQMRASEEVELKWTPTNKCLITLYNYPII